jgi:hypothetical protein
MLAAVLVLCFLQASTTFSHEILTTTVLFDREIVRILNNRCVMCHSENGPAFSLETYEQTWLQGRKIRAAVIARHMPPWPAVPGYGQFANDNALTLRETQFMTSWVEGLGPRNAGTVFTNVIDTSGKPRPQVKAQPHTDHWQLGQPDVVRPVDAGSIEPRQSKAIKQVVIDLGLKAERRLRGLEFIPGDRRVVRAVSFTVQETGEWIGSWTPWYGLMELPAGVAIRLAAGSHIVADVHYQPAKEAVMERGSLGLFFTDKPAAASVSNLVLETKADAAQRFRAENRLAADTRLIALRPEIGPGVKSVEVSAKKPDGSTEVLLFAKDFSPDWPTPYILKEPVLLRRGTVLSVVAYGGPVKLTISRY